MYHKTIINYDCQLVINNIFADVNDKNFISREKIQEALLEQGTVLCLSPEEWNSL